MSKDTLNDTYNYHSSAPLQVGPLSGTLKRGKIHIHITTEAALQLTQNTYMHRKVKLYIMHNTDATAYTTLHKDITGSQALRAPQETKLGNAALFKMGSWSLP